MRLTADHGGLPAGSEIQIGYAEAAGADGAARHDDRRRTTTTEPTVTEARRYDPSSRRRAAAPTEADTARRAPARFSSTPS